MLDYKGTNQLIAREIASDLAAPSAINHNDDDLRYTPIDSIIAADFRGNIHQALGEFEKVVKANSKVNSSRNRRIGKSGTSHPTNDSTSDLYGNKPNISQKQTTTMPLHENSPDIKQNESLMNENGPRIEIPSPADIKIPLLEIIFNLGELVELHDTIKRVGSFFNIPEVKIRNRQSRFYLVFNENLITAAYSLLSDRLVEVPRPGYWNISAEGIRLLKSRGKAKETF